MQTAQHWATHTTPPTVWICSFPHWKHYARQRRGTPIPPPGHAFATESAPRGSPLQSQPPGHCRAAPSHRPTFPPILSSTACTLPSSVSRSPQRLLALPQVTCRGQCGAPTSVPCRLPSGGDRWPSSLRIPWQSSGVPDSPPKTAAASVLGWLSLPLQAPLTPTVVTRLLPPSYMWCPPAPFPVNFLRRHP